MLKAMGPTVNLGLGEKYSKYTSFPSILLVYLLYFYPVNNWLPVED